MNNNLPEGQQNHSAGHSTANKYIRIWRIASSSHDRNKQQQRGIDNAQQEQWRDQHTRKMQQKQCSTAGRWPHHINNGNKVIICFNIINSAAPYKLRHSCVLNKMQMNLIISKLHALLLIFYMPCLCIRMHNLISKNTEPNCDRCYELCSGKTYGYSNEYQTVVIKLLLYQIIQYQSNYNILANKRQTHNT